MRSIIWQDWAAVVVILGGLGAFTRWAVKAIWNAVETVKTNTMATSYLSSRTDELGNKIQELKDVVDGRIGSLESDVSKIKAKLGMEI